MLKTRALFFFHCWEDFPLLLLGFINTVVIALEFEVGFARVLLLFTSLRLAKETLNAATARFANAQKKIKKKKKTNTITLLSAPIRRVRNL